MPAHDRRLNPPRRPGAPPRAKLFMHGRSQAVRLPKEFRFEGEEVQIKRVGDAVLLEPVVDPRAFDSRRFWAKLDALRAADFPDVTDDDLRPELDDDPVFD